MLIYFICLHNLCKKQIQTEAVHLAKVIDNNQIFRVFICHRMFEGDHSVLEDLLNGKNSSHYGAHVFHHKKPRGKEVHIQSNQRSKVLEDIAIVRKQI